MEKKNYLTRFFCFDKDRLVEYCYYVQSSRTLTKKEIDGLRPLMAGAEQFSVQKKSSTPPQGTKVIEIGPLLRYESPWGSQAMQAILDSDSESPIVRIEHSMRYWVSEHISEVEFLESISTFDSMTQMVYRNPPTTLDPVVAEMKQAKIVKILELEEDKAKAVLESHSIDKSESGYWLRVFKEEIKRNPTTLELFSIAFGLTEHSKHPYMNRPYLIDGTTYPSLFSVLKEAYWKHSRNTVSAFNDNASATEGTEVEYMLPEDPTQSSVFTTRRVTLHPLVKIETHNFPTGVSPDPGAATGVGGALRDKRSLGKGSFDLASIMGIHVGALQFQDHIIPGENRGLSHPSVLATPLRILVQGTDGACRYNNQHGTPGTTGNMSSFDQMVDEKRRAYLKPILMAGGVGAVVKEQSVKGKAEAGLKIVMIGGPAYPIGMGGGKASSEIQSEKNAERDFNAVQRDNAFMANKTHRIVLACIELGIMKPNTGSIIVSIHDQGAAGPCNVLTEIIEEMGGEVDLSQIVLGDKSMTYEQIWGAEYQERLAVLIHVNDLKKFRNMCAREGVNCEVLGDVTDTGRIVVKEFEGGETLVDLPLATFSPPKNNTPIVADMIPRKLSSVKYSNMLLADALKNTFAQLSVSYKGWLMHKLDRSVGGKVIRQQECGPMQIPIANAGVTRLTYGSKEGICIAIGQQSNMMMIDEEAGARMTVAQALLKLFCTTSIGDIRDIKSCLNEMWAGKLPGQDARLYRGVASAIKFTEDLLQAIIGGKDSLSLAAKDGDEIIMSPDTLVATLIALIPDVSKVYTPDIKRAGESRLGFIDLSCGKFELGGSPFAQSTGNIGNKTPDIYDVQLFANGLKVLNEANNQGLFLSLHKRISDGLLPAISDMVIAGKAGVDFTIPTGPENAIPYLYSCEAGVIVEYTEDHEEAIHDLCEQYNVPFLGFGKTTKTESLCVRTQDNKIIFDFPVKKIHGWAETTGYYVNKEQIGEKLAYYDFKAAIERKVRKYHLTFTPTRTSPEILVRKTKHKVAILREEGSNGDRDAAYYMRQAGFDAVDIVMSDLMRKKATLENCRGMFGVGGFSYGDTFGSGVVWATKVKNTPHVMEMYSKHFKHPYTFGSFNCNGCQAFSQMLPEVFDPIPGLKGNYPRPTHNISRKFESRTPTLKVVGKSIFTEGMVGSEIPIPSAHAEGRFQISEEQYKQLLKNGNIPFVYVDDEGVATEKYPFCPNGSSYGVAGLTSDDGRFLWMMPHSERWNSPENEQWPEGYGFKLEAAPWLKLMQNAREWCDENA